MDKLELNLDEKRRLQILTNLLANNNNRRMK